jgi:hypothetical protein
MKFYAFTQNNSGGYFINNEEFGIAEFIIIQAESHNVAWEKLKSFEAHVPDLFDYCSCCGERWSDWLSESDGKSTPEIFGKSVYTLDKDIYRERCFVHFHNGTIEKIVFKEKTKV